MCVRVCAIYLYTRKHSVRLDKCLIDSVEYPRKAKQFSFFLERKKNPKRLQNVFPFYGDSLLYFYLLSIANCSVVTAIPQLLIVNFYYTRDGKRAACRDEYIFYSLCVCFFSASFFSFNFLWKRFIVFSVILLRLSI